MPDPFISRQDFVDHVGTGGTADPGMLIDIDAACDIVRTLTEQTINEVIGDTVVLDGTGTDCLLLPELPVSAAGTVTVNGSAVTNYTLSANGMLFRGTVDPTSSIWYDSAVFTYPPVWPRGRQNITVTYDHGYADADIPRDLRRVALAIAERLSVQGVAVSERVGDSQITYAGAATDLTRGEQWIIRKFRR